MQDLISRQAAIGVCDNAIDLWHGQLGEGIVIAVKKKIEELPSAQPEIEERKEESAQNVPKEDLISRKAAIDYCYQLINVEHQQGSDEMNYGQERVNQTETILHHLELMPSAQPEKRTEERTETHACDLIDRQVAIDALTSHIMPHNNEDGTVTIGVLSKSSIKNILNKLPSAQPEHTNSCYTNSWCIDCKEYDTENKCCPRYNRVIKQTLDDAYRHGETEAEARFHAQQRWIPCSERLPEFKYETYDADDDYTFWDTDFVIGATSRGTLSIGQFTRDSDKPNEFHWDACECDAFDLQGCLRIGDHIIAWMPLPESYTEDKE